MLRRYSGRAYLIVAIPVAALAAACSQPEQTVSPSVQTAPESPSYTAGVGFGGALLARAAISEAMHVKRQNGHWGIDIHANGPTDVSSQSLTIQPGGNSGWHSHPGPVFVQITSGTITFYEAQPGSCTPVVRTAGQVFVEEGDHAHISRNEGTVVVNAVATVFSPPGLPLRIDEASPGNCPF